VKRRAPTLFAGASVKGNSSEEEQRSAEAAACQHPQVGCLRRQMLLLMLLELLIERALFRTAAVQTTGVLTTVPPQGNASANEGNGCKS
jgi:hypothetical protein